ncbi:MAG: aldose 1-epimerase family protein [Oscillospiraceae bacterium]
MDYTLENQSIRLVVSSKGAEIQSLQSRANGTEYIWQANAKYWGQKSPVLFPVIARQKNGFYHWGGKRYEMPMHGFAQQGEFELGGQGPGWAEFVLRESESTLPLYPFHFRLLVGFRLVGKGVTVEYRVANRSALVMPYAIGGHTGYNVPLQKGEKYSDYAFFFEEEETAPRYPLVNGLLQAPVAFLKGQKQLALSETLFNNGALIFKKLRSPKVALRSRLTGRGIAVECRDFEYLGLWAAPGAPFVCVEPWNGLPSGAADGQALEEKEGIHLLQPGQAQACRHTISIE